MLLLLLGKEIADICKAYPALHLLVCARLVDDDKGTQLCSTNMQTASPELRRAMVATLQDLIKELDPKPEPPPPPPVQQVDPDVWHRHYGRGWGTPFWTGPQTPPQQPRGGPQPGTDPPPRSGRPFKEYGEAFKYEAAKDDTHQDAVDAAAYAHSYMGQAKADAVKLMEARMREAMDNKNTTSVYYRRAGETTDEWRLRVWGFMRKGSLWVPDDGDNS